MSNKRKKIQCVLFILLLLCTLCICGCGKKEVTFQTNGGDPLETITVKTLESAPIPQRSGYTFLGWHTDSKLSRPAVFPLELNTDVTLYAKWKKIIYTVSFNSNGGSKVGDQTAEVIQTAPGSVRSGYEFQGWYTDEALTKRAIFPLKVKENITLFAKWEKIIYTVSFEVNGGMAIDPRRVEVLEYSPTTVRTGYVFKGWYKDAGYQMEAKFPLNITTDMTLYAKWEKVLYLVSFDSNGGSNCATLQTTRIDKAPTSTRGGYVFDGWYRDSALTERVGFPLDINKDMTLYAKWLRTSIRTYCKDISIKYLDNSQSNGYYFSLRPKEFDYVRLASEGYTLTVTVTYDVRYKKDYDVLWDIGYAGSPQYEISLTDSDEKGVSYKNMSTNTVADSRSITLTVDAMKLLQKELRLRFSTDNIQNIIYFENINIFYQFSK